MSEVGSLLRDIRKLRGYRTQGELAEALGVGQEYVSRVETGKLPPSWRYLVSFANLLRVPVEDLLKAAHLVERPVIDESEIAAMIAAYPRLAEAFELARSDRTVLAELENFARLVIAAKRQDDGEQSHGPAADDATAPR